MNEKSANTERPIIFQVTAEIHHGEFSKTWVCHNVDVPGREAGVFRDNAYSKIERRIRLLTVGVGVLHVLHE